MKTVEQIVTEEELNQVWGSANFGSQSRRDVIAETLLKCACGYQTGYTAKCIAIELGLIYKSKWQLTSRGKDYLLFSYYKSS